MRNPFIKPAKASEDFIAVLVHRERRGAGVVDGQKVAQGSR